MSLIADAYEAPGTPRLAADVVVPFAGSETALDALVLRLHELRLAAGDTVVVADNRSQARGERTVGPVRVVAAGARPGSYAARNVGAAHGCNPWIVFIDADVSAPPDLLDRYFATAPPDCAAVLVGQICDEPPGGASGPAVRYAHLSGLMSQQRTTLRPRWRYAQTANCAVRRSAFSLIDGFVEEARSGGDADLCFRLRDAGWSLHPWPHAEVVHVSRESLQALLRQRVRVGAGARWLDTRHPGFSPARPLPRVFVAGTRLALRGALARARGDRDRALLLTMEGATDVAFQLGMRLPNRVRRARR